ncbi:MAG: tetratricopeptide repeat protein, partial [Spartobacteria bacterium]
MASFNRALGLQAEFPEALLGRARSLEALRHFPEAIVDFENAIRLKPDLFDAHYRVIDLFCRFGKHAEALEKTSRLLTLSPQNIPALIRKNKILQSLNRNADSIAVASQILAIDPRCAEAHRLKADAFRNTSNLRRALEAYDEALRIQPDFPEAHYGRGIVLQAFKRFDEAIISYNKASLGRHEQKRLLGRAILCRMMICDWADLNEQRERLALNIEEGNHATTPFAALTVIHSPRLLLQATQLYINDVAPDRRKSYQSPKLSNSKKIRIGYFSSDFRNHPVSQLIVGFLEHHDRSRFETIGIN